MKKRLINYFVSAALFALSSYEYKTPKKERDMESKIVEIANSSLPRGVSGFYEPAKDKGAIGRDLPGFYKEFVRQHEIAHALGADGSAHGEYLADVYAAERTGNPNLIRGPFYKPPIWLG